MVDKKSQYRGGGQKGRRMPSQLLSDLRAVYSQEKELDRTPGQRALREKFENDPDGYFKLLKEAERDYAVAAGKVSSGQREEGEKAGPVDVGSAKCIALAEQLIKELTGGG